MDTVVTPPGSNGRVRGGGRQPVTAKRQADSTSRPDLRSPLAERPLLNADEAAGVAALFKVLASDVRLRLLHMLVRQGEVRAGDLALEVGLSQQGVSNQLQRLVDRRVLATRREGTSIYYRIVDPCVPQLLEFGLCLLHTPTECDAG